MSVFGDQLPQCLWGRYRERVSFSGLHMTVIQTKRRLAGGGGSVCLQGAPSLMAEAQPMPSECCKWSWS